MFQGPLEVEIRRQRLTRRDGYMLEQLLGSNPPPDRWDGGPPISMVQRRPARCGSQRSIATGRPVTIEELGVTLRQDRKELT